MATKKISAAVASVASIKKPQPSEGDLAHLRSKLAYGRDVEMTIESLTQRLADQNAILSELRTRELPDLFEKLGIDSLGLDASGNLPGYDTKLKPYYSANLPKEGEGREEALALLKTYKAEDLSKTKVEVQFGRGDQKLTKKLTAFLRKSKIPFDSKTGVHASTLTAWVREKFTNKEPLSQSDLKTLGATVGKVVEMKRRKTQ